MLENTRRERYWAHPLGGVDELTGCSCCHPAFCAIVDLLKPKQNLTASLVDEGAQNRSWTAAEQFRSSLCPFVPLLWGDIHMLVALAAVQLGRGKKRGFGPVLADSATAPQTQAAERGGMGTGKRDPKAADQALALGLG